jgi:uncharacterized membrane protein YbhN (UPF0104 family)
VDFGAVLARVGRVQFYGTLLATVLLLVQLALNAARWVVLMRLAGGTLYYHQAFQVYLESMFFYQMLPLGVLGGDGIRVYRTVRLGSPLIQAASSVLLDRLAGLLGLVLLIVVGLPMFYRMVEDVAARSVFAALIIAGIGGAIALVSLPWLPVRWHRHYLVGVLVGFAGLAARMLRERKYLAPTLALTVAGHSSSIIAAWLLAESLFLPIRLLDCFVLMPAALLISMVPITVADWGMREGAVVAAFALIGVAADQALSLSVLFGLAWLGIGLIGGLVWLTQSLFGNEPIRRVSLAEQELSDTPRPTPSTFS